MLLRGLGVLIGFGGLLLALRVIVAAVLLGSVAMRLRRILVMLGGLCVCVLRHFKILSVVRKNPVADRTLQ